MNLQKINALNIEVIHEWASIEANATILANITIGNNAIADVLVHFPPMTHQMLL